MRKTIYGLLSFTFLMLCFFSAFAQESKSYEIQLNAGKFTPKQNSADKDAVSAILSKSTFLDTRYVVLQFLQLPTDAQKKQLLADGIRLLDYLPQQAFMAAVEQTVDINRFAANGIRSVFQLTVPQKTIPSFLNGNFPAHAVKQTGTVDVTVTTYEKLSLSQINPSFSNLGIIVLEDMPMFKSFTVRISQSRFKELVQLNFVQWVEAVDPPNVPENLLGRTLHRVNVLNDGVRNLKGQGVNVGIWDESAVFGHLDFTPVADRLTILEPGTASSHSTHCAGTIGGGGYINPKARGMAPLSKIFSWNFNGNIAVEAASGIPTYDLSVSSHSYGGTATCGLTGSGVAYSTTSRNTDVNLNNFPNHLHVHSSGNSQTSCTGGWSTITGSGKTSKNNILVANITTTEALSGSSSCGPVADGRVKPEISAFGTSVLSTYPNNSYGTISGTSMATPGVAGTAALLVQRFRQLNSNANPISSLIKNTLLNTAQDLGNIGPDYRFGYGRLNALSAVKVLEENRYVVNTIGNGNNVDITLTVPSTALRLQVMLTWNDPAGTANANPALVNNLDLTVINGATTSLPWILDPVNPGSAATRGTDNVSNIEQVTIDFPAAGTYIIRVSGTSIPVGPQQYSLTWNIDEPYVEVIFPNGGESLSPGTAETITWDQKGITGNQTVEYSLNNGANWTTLSTTVAANITRLNWTPPTDANTSTALVRVSSGSLSDVSNVNFKILGTPTSLNPSASCAAGEINFTWNAVASANAYELLRLNQVSGGWEVLATNIAGTNYTATGLTPGATMWFSLVAKNSGTGAVSDRSLAISTVIPSTGLAAIGSITGNDVICGAVSNVQYSVPAITGASSYTWTVPVGATIASGQGSNTIAVNYPVGSNSGNVTVFANAGACLTSTAILAVSVSSTGVAAPISGGNQTQSYCSPNPLPILTASANVPAGHELVWYDAPTGGMIVPTPTLNSVGSVTYYAASKNTSTSCESNTRTSITLTITVAAAPTISASGSTTFCTGGNVTLTASTGNSYTWSNGATTPSIVVTAAGNYSVTVNQGGGCIGTSAATSVTVNPLPTVGITANSSTTFCVGNSVTLTASAGNSYTWSNGATTPSITVNNAGSYTVTVNQGNACVNTSVPTLVTVNPLPIVNITASGPTSFCEGENVVLSSSTGSTYLWSNGATTASITASASGNYSVRVGNSNGCSNTSAATAVIVSPKPAITLSAFPFTRLYPGLNTTLTANSTVPVTYSWFRNGNILAAPTGSTLPVNVDQLGNYSVRVTNAAGCSNTSALLSIADSASAQLFIYPNPNNGIFQVSYYNAGTSKQTITVHDAKGARVYTKTFDINTPYQRMNINVRNHGKGTFIVTLSNANNQVIISEKVLVL